jgi:hypothetical protein
MYVNVRIEFIDSKLCLLCYYYYYYYFILLCLIKYNSNNFINFFLKTITHNNYDKSKRNKIIFKCFILLSNLMKL